jgi:phosphoribosylformylglycinamidine synthase
MVGLVEDLSNKMTLDFKAEGDEIFLIGNSPNDISSSQYLSKICGVKLSPAPHFEIEEEYALQQTISSLISLGLIQSAHDISEGGLFTTLLESAFHRELGFNVKASDTIIRRDAWLFGEGQSRVVVSVNAQQVSSFKEVMQKAGVPFSFLGKVTATEVIIDENNWGAIAGWKEKYDTAIEKHLTKELESEGALTMI